MTCDLEVSFLINRKMMVDDGNESYVHIHEITRIKTVIYQALLNKY